MTPPLLRAGFAVDVDVRRVAITDAGRRDHHQSTIDAITHIPSGSAVILEHAGPAAARWSLDRPSSLGADVIDPVTARRARRLDDAGIEAVIAAWAGAAQRVRSLGGRPIVAAIDDDLLHTALSPLGGGGHATEVVVAVLRACAPCDLLLTVEDLAPGGLSPAQGLAFAGRAVTASGASRLFAAGGTGWLEPLRRRRKGRSVDRSGLGLASATWCIGALATPAPVEVWGVVRDEIDVAVTLGRAGLCGLQGVLQLVDEDVSDGAGQPGSP